MRMKFRKWIAVSGIVVLLEVAPGWMMVGTGAQKPGRSGQKSLGVAKRAELTRLPSESKRWALLVGVDEYESGRISPLMGASNDAEKLAEALVKYAGFPLDQVIVLSSKQAEARRPKRNNIIDQLDKVIGNVPEDGLFLFAFSGHGTEAEQKGYLLPQDAISADRNVRVLENTAIPVEYVREEIRIKGVRQVIVLLDSCRNDPRKDRGGGDNLMAEPLAAGFDFDRRNTGIEGFVTFYATKSGMRAYEDPERRQGYFSQAFIEGLSGRAKNMNGEVTLAGLMKYIEDQVPVYVRRSQERSARQEPRTAVEGYRAADLVLSVTAPVVAPTPTPTPTPTLDPEEEGWKVIATSKNPEVVRGFLRLNPNGRYAGAAQLKLKELETATTAEEIRKPGLILTPTAFTTGTMVNGKLSRSQGECEVYREDLGNGVELEMVKVPGGEFLMGEDEARAAEYEKECGRWDKKEDCKIFAKWQTPRHRVKVEAFLMGKYEVTQRQWRVVMGGLPPELEKLEEKFKGDDKPVVNVSWEEVKEFIKRLGKGYRLPSEAEWEYAARGGTSSAYGFGEEINPVIVNYNGNYPAGKTKKGLYRNGPVDVGELGLANRYGLYDMHGNVWEWCEDDWHESYNGAPTDSRAWIDASRAAYRVIRGSSWNGSAVLCRSAYRYGFAPGGRGNGVGFRLSRTLPSALLPSGRD